VHDLVLLPKKVVVKEENPLARVKSESQIYSHTNNSKENPFIQNFLCGQSKAIQRARQPSTAPITRASFTNQWNCLVNSFRFLFLFLKRWFICILHFFFFVLKTCKNFMLIFYRNNFIEILQQQKTKLRNAYNEKESCKRLRKQSKLLY